VGYTPALAKLMCLEGPDETTYLKAERHLEQTGGITVSGRADSAGDPTGGWSRAAMAGATNQTGRLPALQRAHHGCQRRWHWRADGIGGTRRPQRQAGRRQSQDPPGAYLGCVFTQHRVDEEGRPVRDWESTTYVSDFMPIDEFGPMLRQEAHRRGYGTAAKVVVFIDGANGLGNMATINFNGCIQIVDFYHAMEHAGLVLDALIGKTHPDYKAQLHHWAKWLLKDKVEDLIKQARHACVGKLE